MATLRRATASDAAALARLRGHMHAAMGDPPTEEFLRLAEQAFARRLPTGDLVAFVVESEGEVVAGGVGWVEEHLPSPYQLDPRRGHVASMSTHPDHRRRGYARQVLEALMAHFAALGVPRVDLRATPSGQPLYEDVGFAVLGGATMAWTAPGSRPGMR